MTKATKPATKRIACVGEDDPTYITDLVRGLEQHGLTARHMSVFSLRLAPRPPDLTVLIGSAAKDGGVEMVAQLGEQRGPFAIVMAKGALAARLDARQRGLHVVPRTDRGEEMAPTIAKLLTDIEGGATATTPPLPGPSAVALDGLDWDDEHDALTVNTALPRPEAPVSSSAKTVKPAAPRAPRATLVGGFPSFPKPKRPPAPTEPTKPPSEAAAKPERPAESKPAAPPPPPREPVPMAPEVLVFDEATEVGADVHSAVTRPHTIDPTETEGATKALLAPPASRPATIEEPTFTGEKAPLEPAPADPPPPSEPTSFPGEAPSPADAGVTAPHPPIFAGNEAVTAEQDALFASDAGHTTEHDALERRFPQPAPSAAATAAAPPGPGRAKLAIVASLALLVVTGAALAGGVYLWMARHDAPVLASTDPVDPHPAAAPPEGDLTPSPLKDEHAEAEAPDPLEAEVSAEAAPAAPAGEDDREDQAEARGVQDALAEAAPPAPQTAPSDPEDTRALSDTLVAEAEAHRRANRLAEAHAAFTRAADVHPHNPHAHAGLARLALARGDAPAAVEHAERAARLRRRRPEYQILLGDMRREAGDRAGARAAYERALELDPDHAQARARLGE